MWFCRLSITSSRCDLDRVNLFPWCQSLEGGCSNFAMVKGVSRKYVAVFRAAQVSSESFRKLSEGRHGWVVKLTWRDLETTSGHIYVARFASGEGYVVPYTPLEWVKKERGVDFSWLKTEDFLKGKCMSEMKTQLRAYLKANKLEKFICMDELIAGLA